MSNPIKQYTDLYRQHRDTVCANAPDVLNAVRDRALAIVSDGRLPKKGSEGYEKVSLPEMFAPDYGVNITRVAFPVEAADVFRCDVPRISTLNVFISGDTFVAGQSLQRGLPEGVTVMSLARAAAEMPELVSKYYNRLVPDHNIAANLNTLFAQDGIFVHVAKGVRPDRALQVVNLMNSLQPMMAVRRVLIVLEAQAELSVLVCDHSQRPDVDYLADQVIEVYLGDGARLNFCDMEESTQRTSRISQMFVKQEASSDLRLSAMTLMNGTTRNNFIIDLDGEGCQTRLSGMVIGTDKSLGDNGTLVRHHVPHCHSDQLFKYVLSDASQGAFEGTIVVDEAARFTSAYQSNRNILASADARMHTKPQLEIYCDEVKCSHGATTGQLDANALFYMRTRGIPEQQARMMLMQAFMADVVDSVAIEPLRDRLHHLVEKRLAGEPTLCADCSAASLGKSGDPADCK